MAARPPGEAADAFLTVSGSVSPSGPVPKKLETLTGRAAKQLPHGVVRDERHPTMYRVVRPNGSLSDMVNLTRAKDALRCLIDGGAS
jgi:hypothetical protein